MTLETGCGGIACLIAVTAGITTAGRSVDAVGAMACISLAFLKISFGGGCETYRLATSSDVRPTHFADVVLNEDATLMLEKRRACMRIFFCGSNQVAVLE